MALIKSYHCGGETLGTVVKHSVRDSTVRFSVASNYPEFPDATPQDRQCYPDQIRDQAGIVCKKNSDPVKPSEVLWHWQLAIAGSN